MNYTAQEHHLYYASLYRTPDDGATLIPVQFQEPSEPNSVDQLAAPQQAYIAMWGHDVFVDQEWRIQCFFCDNKTFYARKAFNRHFDDKHSAPKQCPICHLAIIGKRKLKAHVKRVHPTAHPLKGN